MRGGPAALCVSPVVVPLLGRHTVLLLIPSAVLHSRPMVSAGSVRPGVPGWGFNPQGRQPSLQGTEEQDWLARGGSGSGCRAGGLAIERLLVRFP